MKKFLCLFLAMIAVLSVSLPVSAASVDSEETEIELSLDEFGNAGVTYGYVVYESETAYFNLANPDESAAFEAIQDNTNANSRSVQPRSIGTFHVGIQKSGSAYRMHYTVTGSGLLSAVGYMKCKSTELLFASTYHDEYFKKSSTGTSSMSGYSNTFTLPSGTTSVKVGWHDVTIRDGDGEASVANKYATVTVN